MIKKYFMSIIFFVWISLPAIFWGQDSNSSANASQLGILTIVPPLLAIILAFITKQVFFALFLGLWSGSFLLCLSNGFQLHDFYFSFEKITSTIIDIMADPWNVSIIVQVTTIGGLIAVIGQNGGSKAVAEMFAKKAKSAKSAQIFACIGALFIFFDDYANTLITGPVMRSVTDKLHVSREKLAFVIDATAAPVAGLALISTWIGYELGVMKDAFEIAGYVNPNTYAIFIETLPYRFYNFLIIGFIILLAVLNRDFGPMLKAEQRARLTGNPIPHTGMIETEDTTFDPLPNIPLHAYNALVPIISLILLTFIGFWYDGTNALAKEYPNAFMELSFYEYILKIFSLAEVGIVIFRAALLSSVIAIIISAATKTVGIFQSINAWINGAKMLSSTVIILVLAWSIAAIIKELGTSYFLIQIFQDVLPAKILPALIFLFAALISFSTGSAYGTMGIMMPLAVPLVSNLSGNNWDLVTMATGAVLTGAIVGDHCSPISDTTILSASGSGCPLISHVDTQLPYSLLVAVVSLVFGYLLTAFGLPVFLSYLLGFGVLVAVLLFYGKEPDSSKVYR